MYDENTIVEVKKKKRLSKDQIIKIIEVYYDKDTETEDIIVDKDGFITFTKYFKYLGSFISFILNDDHDIAGRIKKTNQSMGSLKLFWDAKEVDLRSIFLIYNAIPISLLLLGSESWALTKVLIKNWKYFI